VTLPKRHYEDMRWLARMFFRLRGWEYTGIKPEARRFVAIGAPHTSNWDFVILLAVASHFGFKPKTIGKATLVRGPFGGLMTRLGIIPVKRDSGQGMVEQMAQAFAESADLALVLAPEGTRGAEPYWRSGFYQIALAAGVPIVPARVDAARKQAGVGLAFMPTGDVTADMDVLRDFYTGAVGFNPGGESAVRLREEDDSGSVDS
jgi:1-acyl-sn-glycerol-3-phosphate acyltransferase